MRLRRKCSRRGAEEDLEIEENLPFDVGGYWATSPLCPPPPFLSPPPNPLGLQFRPPSRSKKRPLEPPLCLPPLCCDFNPRPSQCSVLSMLFCLLVLFSMTSALQEDDFFRFTTTTQKPKYAGNKLLMVVLNGFRWDYISRDMEHLPNFRRFIEEGSSAPWLNSVFPADGYPAWASIATGLWPEDHGIIGNYFYDSGKREVFELNNLTSTRRAHWWQRAQPIWVTATMANRDTSVYLFSRCDVPYKGYRIPDCIGYNGSMNDLRYFDRHLESAMEDFEQKDYAFSIVFNEYVGRLGRNHGPESNLTFQGVRRVDKVLGHLFTRLRQSHLRYKINIMIVSDHGMSTLRRMKIINMDDHLHKYNIQVVIGRGGYMNIIPVAGLEDRLMKSIRRGLSDVRIYSKKDIPDRLHWKKSPLILPDLILANEGVYLNALSDPRQFPRGPSYTSFVPRGVHGFDPSYGDMRTIFMGWGPDFYEGYETNPLEMPDIYLVISHLLSIPPINDHAGSWQRVKYMLVNDAPFSIHRVFFEGNHWRQWGIFFSLVFLPFHYAPTLVYL
ncbi:unnamed protein product [Cyprideis torosa]|uniref:Uncharacterized protein n=1 Tax=Cyprideis torosa TaxID=163714 RepID=A0A7R8ZLY8_9CRUS|nr:unnamed protein product [Cyprideis torosa]CAG0883164.1 unnamed protein product [Cyprideis torosa]